MTKFTLMDGNLGKNRRLGQDGRRRRQFSRQTGLHRINGWQLWRLVWINFVVAQICTGMQRQSAVRKSLRSGRARHSVRAASWRQLPTRRARSDAPHLFWNGTGGAGRNKISLSSYWPASARFGFKQVTLSSQPMSRGKGAKNAG